MISRILPTLLLLHLTQSAAPAEEPIKALEFGTTHEDYVKFYPDMGNVAKALTVCSWVKKQLRGAGRSWITYTTTTHSYEILISDEGHFNYIHNAHKSFTVSVPLNTWTLQCQSWTADSGEINTYYNGTMIGSHTASTAPLEQGGYILLGHDSGSRHEYEIFGGQLMNLNIFGKVLTDAEIAELYNAGRCSSEAVKKHEDVRYITWESILTQTRTGNVWEVNSGCPAPETAEEEETETGEEAAGEDGGEETVEGGEECECPEKKYSIWDLLLEDKFVNQTLTGELLAEIKAAWNILGKSNRASTLLKYYLLLLQQYPKNQNSYTPLCPGIRPCFILDPHQSINLN